MTGAVDQSQDREADRSHDSGERIGAGGQGHPIAGSMEQGAA
jgi:hypothetical protein